MIVNNTQANVFKVNGGLADIFANRPAPNSSFFIFYSIDTQQIFYDNGAWVLMGSGAPSVNIYNSNGTLTGNRALNGGGFDLFFSNLDDIYFNSQSISLRLLNTNDSIITYKSGNEVGLKLDYANQVYQFGQINGGGNSTTLQINDAGAQIRSYFFGNAFPDGLDITSQYSKIGYTTIAQIGLQVNANANYIETSDINGINGIYFQYPVSLYEFGQITGGNLTKFAIDDTSQLIKTSNQGNDIGLKLDFANNIFGFGQYFGNGNGCRISIDDNINLFEIATNSTTSFAIFQDIITIGDINGIYQQTRFFVDYVNNIIKTSNQGNDIGLKLDFAAGLFQMGDYIGYTNYNYIDIDNSISPHIKIQSQSNVYLGDHDANFNETSLNINVTIGNILTRYQGGDIGLQLDFAADIYSFGDPNGITLGSYIEVANNLDRITLFAGSVSGNSTRFIIDDPAAYPLQFDGNNIVAGSSGSSSGQHLKVKVNGTDYVIELKNP